MEPGALSAIDLGLAGLAAVAAGAVNALAGGGTLITFPVGPTARLKPRVRAPDPLPASSTVMPGAMSA